ncbi:MAG: response regulator transcription factor [Chloroflexi bacterium]|nr:MAG: response regulator transcription factor [Chloroflexota bacterium]
MRGVPSRRRRRAREGAHPSMRDRAPAGDDARIGRIRARDASSIRWIRAWAQGHPAHPGSGLVRAAVSPTPYRVDRSRAARVMDQQGLSLACDKLHHIVKRNRKEMDEPGHIPVQGEGETLLLQGIQIHGGRSAVRRAILAGRQGVNIVNRYRVLIVDDDAMAREILKRILEHAGYEVMTAGSGPEALRKLHDGIPHLVVVDLMMPDMDGFELCRRIKSHLDVPIMILSAVAALESKVEGLQMYAEDYIVKPFEKEELVARIQRVLRRFGESAGVEQPEVVIDPDLQINFVQHWARVRGKQLTLTPTESKLLFLLVRNAGRVVTNETLLAKAWDGDEEAYEEGLRVHISRLRAKIEPQPNKPTYIHTKRGVGYRFNGKVTSSQGPELALAG